ncbi:hypothetical protein [Agrobacterium sp. CG674]
MFLKEYFEALTTPAKPGFEVDKAKAAFGAGKALSDIIAMVNRAFWLLAFALLLNRAYFGLGPDLGFGYKVALWTCIAIFGWIIPAILGLQILYIAFRSLDKVKPEKHRIWYKGAVTIVFALLMTAVNFSWIAVNKDFERQELAKKQLAWAQEQNRQ